MACPRLRLRSVSRRVMRGHTTSFRACATSSWPATPAPARPRSPSTCSSPRAPSRAWAAWTTGRPASTSSRRSRSASCRSRSPSHSLTHDEHRITLIDTPGYADFVGEVIEGFAAADAAIITMDASGGVEAGTETAIALGRTRGDARRSSSSPAATARTPIPSAALDALRASFGTKIAPLHVAIGAAESFRGFVDLVHRKAWTFDKGKRHRGARSRRTSPTRSRRRRDQLLEAAAEADDDVLTKYLEGEEITDAELEACLHKGVRETHPGAGRWSPRRRRDIGVDGAARRDRALPALPRRGAAGQGARWPRAQRWRCAPDPAGPLLAQVFKTTADPFVGRLTYFRVWSRQRSSRTTTSGTRSAARRSASARCCASRARSRSRWARSVAGEIGAVAKLVHTVTGDTLSSRETAAARCRRFAFPEPTLPVAIEPASKADLDKLSTGARTPGRGGPDAPRRARRRDRRAAPLGPGREPDRGRRRAAQAQVRHVGPDPRAARPVPRDDPRPDARSRAATRSRPAAAASSATCGSRSSPTRVVASSSSSTSSGGVVPRQFFPGVEKGVRDVAEKGPIAGYPVIDFKATLYDGSFHTVDSDELSFRLAGSLATRKGIQESQPVLLEPIMDVEVRVPEAYMGDVNRDLNTRRGRVLGMDSRRRQPGRAGAGAPVGAVHLRHRAALADRRPGHVQGHPRPLRGGAGARGPEDHRRAPEGVEAAAH